MPRENCHSEVNNMSRHFGLLLIALAAAPALADSVAVTITGNFGAPTDGSSVFDNQNYSVSFLIPDTASPTSTFCCMFEIAATYNVNATLAVPGLGLSIDDIVQAQYVDEAPIGQWLNIGNFGDLPVGSFFILTPFQIDSGELWNGLDGALGTPVIDPLDDTPGSGFWRLEQNTSMGPIPIAEYENSVATISVAEVPEPAQVWQLGAAFLALGLFRPKRSSEV
jgi:hypothetical protein